MQGVEASDRKKDDAVEASVAPDAQLAILAAKADNTLGGHELYRDDVISVHIMDGMVEPECCSHLCQIGKLLIPSKRVSINHPQFWCHPHS